MQWLVNRPLKRAGVFGGHRQKLLLAALVRPPG